MIPKKFPDKCLLALFRALPLNDKLRARCVCRKWALLMAEVTSSRRQLTILISYMSMGTFELMINRYWSANFLSKNSASFVGYHNRWNTVQFREFDEAAANEIVATFSGITTLQFATSSGVKLYDGLVAVLKSYQTQLVEFKFFDAIFHTKPEPETRRLFIAINDLSSLKRLTLDLKYLQMHALPVLARLSKCNIYAERTEARHMMQILEPAEKNPNLELNYRTVNETHMELKKLSHLSVNLRKKFKQLEFYGNDDLLAPFTSTMPVCSHFTSLTRIYIAPYDMTFRRLFNDLSKLSALNSLQLAIDFSMMNEDNEKDAKCKPLKTVQKLRLELRNMLSHRELEDLNLGNTFPSVQSAEFHFGRGCQCENCGVKSFNLEPLVETLKSTKCGIKCLREMFNHLKIHGGQNWAIWHTFQEDLGSVEELLSDK